jgi:plasmid stabilization system protein ParE
MSIATYICILFACWELEIWSYIAGDNLEAANRVEGAIYSACALLAENPLAGRIREDLTAWPVRFWLVQPFENCWIVYNHDTKPLQVIRILNPARDIASLLG